MNKQQTRYGVHCALMMVCLLMACPALYALQVSTLTLNEAFNVPPQLFPPSPDFDINVSDLFRQDFGQLILNTVIRDFDNNVSDLFRQDFGQLILNTVIVSMVVVIGKTALAMLAGLAFVYFHFPGKTVLFFVILLTLLMPTELIILPLFRLVSTLEWGSDYPRLALTMPFLASAVGMFLFRQHFQNIPRELAEAAQLDGATPLRFLGSVLLPMSWNVIGAHAVIQFISMWNQYLWPLFIIQDKADQVIQVGVRNSVLVGTQTDFGLLMSAGIIASIPPLIFFIVLQKQFMSGFALTRDK